MKQPVSHSKATTRLNENVTAPFSESVSNASMLNESILNDSILTPAQIADGETTHADNKPIEAAEFIEIINSVIEPPKPLGADDVFVRALALVSDARNQHGGRFPVAELQRVAELVIDTPVLVGHRKDRLPIARIFRAELVQQDGLHWVKAWMYWLKEADGAGTLQANIDGGVYKDCSLGFTFARAECSVCQGDIRFCGHTPVRLGIDPPGDDPDFDDTRDVFFYYRDVQRTLEVSLVYRGANPGARVGVGLIHDADRTDLPANTESPGDWLEQLQIERVVALTDDSVSSESAEAVLRYPLLDGLPLLVGRHNGQTLVLRDDGSPAPKKLCSIITALCHFDSLDSDADFLFYARLVGMRGKSKRSCRELIRFLAEDKGPVRSLKLRALALLRHNQDWLTEENLHDFQDILQELCSDNRALSSVRPGITGQSHGSDSETLWCQANGQFRLIRQRLHPIIHAQSAGDSKLTVPVMRDEDTDAEQLEVSLTKSCAVTKAGTVTLAFDNVIADAPTLKLVNPRIIASPGAYHAPETLSVPVRTVLAKRSLLQPMSEGVITLLPGDADSSFANLHSARARVIRINSRNGIRYGLLRHGDAQRGARR